MSGINENIVPLNNTPDNNNNNNIMPNQNQNNDANNNNVNQIPIKITNYTKPSKTGLKNLGETSYLNAVLQLLGQIPELAEYYLNRKNEFMSENNIKERPLSFVTYRLYTHIYPKDMNNTQNQKYKPDGYLRVLCKLNPMYTNKKEKNPNDLLIFILNKLNEELKKKNIICDNLEYYGITTADNKQTIIEDVLSWGKVSKQTCSVCNKSKKPNVQFFNTFDLDISRAHQTNVGKKNEISIYDCLNIYLCKKEKSLFCHNCLKLQQTSIDSKICSINKNILFLLDRGEDNNNELAKIKFKIEEEIDLGDYLQKEKSNQKFKLYGIISNNSENCYVCDCKSPIDKKWYRFCNEDVNIKFDDTQILINDINSTNYIPYILYYKSV